MPKEKAKLQCITSYTCVRIIYEKLQESCVYIYMSKIYGNFLHHIKMSYFKCNFQSKQKTIKKHSME
jgi:hypothetical protein